MLHCLSGRKVYELTGPSLFSVESSAARALTVLYQTNLKSKIRVKVFSLRDLTFYNPSRLEILSLR